MGVDELTSIDIDSEVTSVVAGINYDFSYRILCMASLFIQVNNATFIATNMDRVFSTQDPKRKCPAGGSIV